MPIVRNANTICCGDPSEKALLVLTILTTKKFGNEEIPDSILIQIQSTDKSLDPLKRNIKQSVKTGLYDALDIGITWLKRELGR